ncbi:MAG: PAS domain-containing protein [Methylobacter sp.]
MLSDFPLRQTRPESASHSGILAVVLVYAVFAACWILLSDKLVQMIYSNPDRIILASMLKGWLFVGVTSFLLYSLMLRWVGGSAVSKALSADSRRHGWPFISLAAVIIVFTGAGIFNTFIHHKEEEVSRLQAVAALKTRQIADWLRERQGDADFIQANDFFAEQYQRWQESGDLHSSKRLQIQLEQLRRNRGFSAVTLLNPKAEKLWGSDKAPLVVTPPLQAAAHFATAERKVLRVAPYRDATDTVYLDFIAPLTAMPGSAPLVILHIDLADWLFPILQTWPAPSASSETLLFQREGDQVLFLNELRYQKDTAAKLRMPSTTEKLLAAQVLRGAAALGKPVEGVDYRGIPVIGVVRAVAGSNWFLLAKLDQSELYAEAAGDMAWVGFVGLLALFMAGAGFYLWRQGQQLALAQALQQSQAERLRALHLLAAIADSSDDAIFAKDREGRYILFNQAAGNFVGKPPDEVLGRDDRAIFPAEQAEMLMAIGRQVIARNRIQTLEEVLDTSDGKRVFLATKGPLCDDEGNIIGIFGISRDITEMKRVEQSLRESEERLRLALDATNDGLWDWDLPSGLTYLTPHYYEMAGYRPDEVMPDFEFFKRTVHPEDLDHVLETMAMHLHGKTPASECDYRLVTPAGEIKWMTGRGRVVERDAEERPLWMVGTITDISARKAAEEALRRQTGELAQRNAELERFNRAMIGRELDMIALKQQVNELSRQLGLELPFGLSFLDTLAPDLPIPGTKA